MATAGGLGTACMFDLAPLATDTAQGGTGAGASDGGGTVGTAGAGGDDPPCDPPQPPSTCEPGLDVAPMIAQSMTSQILSVSRPHLVWLDSVFGVYARVDQGSAPTNRFFTMARSGVVLSSPLGPFAHWSNAEVNLGNTANHFAVPTFDQTLQETVVVRFDPCGQQLESIATGESLAQARVVGSGTQWLLTGLAGFDVRYVIVADRGGVASLADTGLESDCCQDLEYASAFALGRFYLAGRPATGSAEVALAAIDPDGTFEYLEPLAGLEGFPRYIGAYGTNLVVATTSHIALVDPSGPTVVDLDPYNNGTSCAFATRGTQLMRACRIITSSPNYISFAEFDFVTGAPLPPNQMGVTAAIGDPSIAWDGSGWGLTWFDNGGVAYAHFCDP